MTCSTLSKQCSSQVEVVQEDEVSSILVSGGERENSLKIACGQSLPREFFFRGVSNQDKPIHTHRVLKRVHFRHLYQTSFLQFVYHYS